ncbi:MAG: acyltransferase [Acidimicrobiales bacterium]|nr:acyltransferase [Acidimicrobiales bacterium]
MREPDQVGSEVEPLGYRPQLDGVRALAIAAVVAFHVDRGGRHALLPGGFLGVDVFFVLSGFLITSLLIDERAGSGRIRLGAFWGRRAARLFPLLWALLALFAFARWVHPIAGISPPSPLGFASLLLYVGNWIPATGRPDLFEAQYLWSLSVEEQFYVLWPSLTVVLLAVRSRWAVASGAIALALTVIVTRPTLFADTNFFFNTFLRCDGLLLGAALAGARHWWQPRLTARAANALVAVGGVAVVWAMVGARVGDPSVAAWRLPLLEVGVIAATAALVASPGGLVGRAVALGPMVWLGRCSYALYLVHLPIFDVLQARYGLDRPRLRAVIEIPLALVVAGVLHRWFELPAQRFLRRTLHVEHRPGDHAPATPDLGTA